MSDLVYTVAQMAEALEISEDLVRQLVREDRIPHFRLGPRTTLFSRAAIDEWLADLCQRNQPSNLTAVSDGAA